MEKFLLISAGAVMGANARYWLGDWVARRWGSAFPLGTLLINITGSFLLGLFMTLAVDRFVIDPRWRFLFAAGFFGAYTTFSTFVFESYDLVFKGQWSMGFLNLFGSVIAGIVFVGLGAFLGRSL